MWLNNKFGGNGNSGFMPWRLCTVARAFSPLIVCEEPATTKHPGTPNKNAQTHVAQIQVRRLICCKGTTLLSCDQARKNTSWQYPHHRRHSKNDGVALGCIAASFWSTIWWFPRECFIELWWCMTGWLGWQWICHAGLMAWWLMTPLYVFFSVFSKVPLQGPKSEPLFGLRNKPMNVR